MITTDRGDEARAVLDAVWGVGAWIVSRPASFFRLSTWRLAAVFHRDRFESQGGLSTVLRGYGAHAIIYPKTVDRDRGGRCERVGLARITGTRSLPVSNFPEFSLYSLGRWADYNR
jgi:hypothetical protein